jgi:hypothetical protein
VAQLEDADASEGQRLFGGGKVHRKVARVE